MRLSFIFNINRQSALLVDDLLSDDGRFHVCEPAGVFTAKLLLFVTPWSLKSIWILHHLYESVAHVLFCMFLCSMMHYASLHWAETDLIYTLEDAVTYVDKIVGTPWVVKEVKEWSLKYLENETVVKSFSIFSWGTIIFVQICFIFCFIPSCFLIVSVYFLSSTEEYQRLCVYLSIVSLWQIVCLWEHRKGHSAWPDITNII